MKVCVLTSAKWVNLAKDEHLFVDALKAKNVDVDVVRCNPRVSNFRNRVRCDEASRRVPRSISS